MTFEDAVQATSVNIVASLAKKIRVEICAVKDLGCGKHENALIAKIGDDDPCFSRSRQRRAVGNCISGKPLLPEIGNCQLRELTLFLELVITIPSAKVLFSRR